MNNYKIIAICGKSAAGKDTFLQTILRQPKHGLHEIVSHTTRPPREGEVNGKNYWFIDEAQFNEYERNNMMLETTSFRDWRYGACIEALDPNLVNIGVFNVVGLKSLLSNDNVDAYIVFMSASDKTRMLRSLYRESNPDVAEIVRRYNADEEDFKDFDNVAINVIIDNDANESLDFAAQKLLTYATAYWAEETN